MHDTMDVSQALKDSENALRDLIYLTLSKKDPVGWLAKCGVTPQRVEAWEKRRAEDQKKFGTSDARMLYYADIYDLDTILQKHWDQFIAALGDKKKFLALFSLLIDYRNADAHRRELLPYQKCLVIGIQGEIRSRIVMYRNKQEEALDHYPRIEYANDNLGSSYAAQPNGFVLQTGLTLRIGDMLQFAVTAHDPRGEAILYSLRAGAKPQTEWQEGHEFTVTIGADDVGKRFIVWLMIKGQGDYRQFQTYDADARFEYEVLPPKR